MRLKKILEQIDNVIAVNMNELDVQSGETMDIIKNLFFATERFLRKNKKPLNKKQQKILLLKIKDSVKGLA